MTSGHTPVRTCIGCRRRRPKQDLIRFTLAGGGLAINERSGRGLYVCRDPGCIELAAKSKAIRRLLGRPLTQSELFSLARMFLGWDGKGQAPSGLATSNRSYGGGAIG